MEPSSISDLRTAIEKHTEMGELPLSLSGSYYIPPKAFATYVVEAEEALPCPSIEIAERFPPWLAIKIPPIDDEVSISVMSVEVL